MQAWTILTAIALVAAIPMAIAAEPDGCDAATPEQDVGPFGAGMYLVLTSPTNIGLWKETNNEPGLQTQACTEDGDTLYEADERAQRIELA
jgi:hypothetical protein